MHFRKIPGVKLPRLLKLLIMTLDRINVSLAYQVDSVNFNDFSLTVGW